MVKRRRAAPPAHAWAEAPDEELLDLRFCDLGLGIEGSPLEPRVQQLRDDLRAAGLRFAPHFWLSTEWFSPSGVPGVAIPFYLAHPRLERLERAQMLEVEGGTEEWCMKLLRHETGHAIDTAYRLHRRKSWRETFGRFSDPYEPFYTPRPYSKRFVLHLDLWYAQSHPAEDFAETFAVWLTPGLDWRRRYRGWPALRKLEYVDQVMGEVAKQAPRVRCREHTERLSSLSGTLRQHYRRKKERYSNPAPDFYDRDLRRLFARAVPGDRRRRADSFLRGVRPRIRRRVARWTHEFQYRIDQVLREMIDRARELELVVASDEDELAQDVAVMLTVQTMNYLHSGFHSLAR